MNKQHYECTFSTEYRNKQNKSSLMLLGVILFVSFSLFVLMCFLFCRELRFYMIAMSVCVAVLALWMFNINIRCMRWLASSFQFAEHGIVIQRYHGKEIVIPWSSIVTVDTGILVGYANQTVPVIRCFLSVSAWEKSTPNLRRQVEETSFYHYFKLRKDCFILEYTQERELTILDFWHSICDNRQGNASANFENCVDPDFCFQNAFGDDIAKYGSATLRIHLVFIGLVIVAIPFVWMLNPSSSDNTIGALGLIALCLFDLAMLNIERPAMTWLRTQYRLSRDGIYIKDKKGKVKFILWADIVDIERKLMSVARTENISVICCYCGLAGKTLLEITPKSNNRGLKYQEYYNRREDVITIGYTKERLAKIRVLWREAVHK